MKTWLYNTSFVSNEHESMFVLSRALLKKNIFKQTEVLCDSCEADNMKPWLQNNSIHLFIHIGCTALLRGGRQ